jgi:hypothetical protein
MPESCKEVCVIGKMAAAMQRISGDPEVLTGVEELAVSLGGDGMAHPVGPAIDRVADALDRIACALEDALKAKTQAKACECAPRAEVPTAVPDQPMLKADRYDGKTRQQLRDLCEKRKIHTNSKMNLTKLVGLLRVNDVRIP